MYCSKCGYKVPDGSKFCPNCGAKLVREERTSTSTAEEKKEDRNDETSEQNSNQSFEDKLNYFGDKLEKGIGDAASEMKNQFEQAKNSEAGQKIQDAAKNWRDYVTPENMEKLIAVNMLLPFCFMVVTGFADHFLNVVRFIPVVHVVALLFQYLIRVIFVAVEAAAVYSAYIVFGKNKEKQTNFGMLALCGTGLSVLAILLSINHASHLSFLFMLCALIIGLDVVSRVILQHRGIETEGDFARDYAVYKAKWEDYNEKQNMKSAETPEQKQSSGDLNENRESGSYFDGSGIEYFGLVLLTVIVSALTCGIASPWMICLVYKWRKSHTVINGRRLEFVGTGGSLIGHWILWALLDIITCGIYLFFEYVALKKWEMENTCYEGSPETLGQFDGSSIEYLGYAIVRGILLILTLGLAGPWTLTMIQKWETRHECVGRDRLYYDGTALGILGQYLIVFILTVITCGIYSSWGIVRINKYIYSHTHVQE